MNRLFARLRAVAGFGMVELLAAMVVLNVGLLALMAAFASGIVTTGRAGRVATASTLADKQMELYRALTYSAIALDPSTIPTSAPYTSDSAYRSSQVTGPTCSDPPCVASQTPTEEPYSSRFRIDSYIVVTTPTNGRTVKQVTVVVRDANNPSNTPLARRSSLFDQSTGM